MVDRILAIVALALLIAFCTLLMIFVQRTDLTIVMVIGLAMASYDLLIYSFRGKR